jgi:hypothetical protein
MPTYAEVKGELVEAIVENVEDNTISESDIAPILKELAKVTANRPLDSWKQLVQHQIEQHETGHATPKATNVKKANNKNSCPYPAQYHHAEACSAYHKALDSHKGVSDAKKEMYKAVAVAAAGGGKTRRSKKTRKAKRTRRSFFSLFK